jgi:hypothetical protein
MASPFTGRTKEYEKLLGIIESKEPSFLAV